jgi:hypothetical protein
MMRTHYDKSHRNPAPHEIVGKRRPPHADLSLVVGLPKSVENELELFESMTGR